MRFKKFFAMLLVAAMFLSMGTGLFPLLDRMSMVAYAAGNSDFVIEDGVLTEYKGSGGDVVIPDSVKEIGSSAFAYCSNLKSVTIPKSVKEIGSNAFSDCRRLTSINVNSQNPSYTSKNGVLYSKDMKVLIQYPCGKTGAFATIPDSVRIIEEEAFVNCIELTSVTIPNSVTEIGDDAFYGCTGLKKINVNSQNPSYTSKDGVLYSKDMKTLIQYPCGKTGTFAIPDSVRTIEDGAFSNSSGLTGITIPNSVQSIGGCAFWGCKGLSSIRLPDSVKHIDDYAFYECTGLTNITLSSSIKKIGESSFEGCNSLTSVTIPNSVKEIGEYAFDYCSSLKSVKIPNSVTEIGDYAFWYCSSLTDVIIPNSVTEIGELAFYGCTSLKKINVNSQNPSYTSKDGVLYSKDMSELIQCPCKKSGAFSIPNSVTEIGVRAFEDCTSLISVTIPNSITEIGYDAFYGCTSLTSVNIPNSVTEIGDGAFCGCTGLKKINVNSQNPSYTSKDGVLYSKDMKTLIQYPCAKTGTFAIPNTVRTIEDGAFAECAGLTGVTIPNSVKEIGFWVFNHCTGLTSITIPKSATDIAENVFYGCTKLTAIHVNSENPNYSSKDGVWYNKEKTELIQCPMKKSGTFTIPNSVTWIDHLSFSGCKGLTSVTIPNSVTFIGSGAFENCTGLKHVTIPDSVNWIGDGAFFGCTGLTSVIIPASVDSINPEASGIEDACFAGCVNLKDVYYGDTELQWKRLIHFNGIPDMNLGINKNATIHYNYVSESLSITTQPSPVTAKSGNTVSFKIKATGEGLTYQWQLSDDQGKTWRDSSAKTAVYSTTLSDKNNGRYVRCIVTDKTGKAVKSNAAYMKITSLKITEQPAPVTAKAGDPVTFKVTASGPSITYQWQLSDDQGKTWRNSKATTASYSTTLSTDNNGRYLRCIVTDKYGNSVKSDAAYMKITSLKITKQPTNAKAAKGSKVTFKVTASGPSITYQWQLSDDQGKTWRNSSTKAATYSTTLNDKNDGRYVRCIVTDKYGNSVISNPARMEAA